MGSYRTKYKLLLILHFKCSLSFVPLDYVLFQQCTLIFFYQNLICFIDTSKKQILMKTRNEEKNIKTHKKPKLYPILFLRKYDFQNIEYVILKWISIKKNWNFCWCCWFDDDDYDSHFIRYMKVMDSVYLLQIGFALLLTLLYCWIK